METRRKREKEREGKRGLTGVPGLLMRPWDAPQFTITATARVLCELMRDLSGRGSF